MGIKVLTAREAEAILQQHGWRLAREKGSMHQYKKEGFSDLASIHVHKGKTLSPGVVRNLYKVTGIDEFLV